MKIDLNDHRSPKQKLPPAPEIKISEIRIQTKAASADIVGLGEMAGKITDQLVEEESKFLRIALRLPGSEVQEEAYSLDLKDVDSMPDPEAHNQAIAMLIWDSEDLGAARATQILIGAYAEIGVAVITMDIRGRVLPKILAGSTSVILPRTDNPDLTEYLMDYLVGILPTVITDTWIVLDFSQGRVPLLAGEVSWCATGQGELPDGATKAISDALANAEIGGFNIGGASSVLLAYTVSPSISVNETFLGAEYLKSALPADCHLIYSLSTDVALEMKIEATLIVSGKRQG